MNTSWERPLKGRVALVAGATRGCGRAIAVHLGLAGATVYATGRTTRARQSEMGRPETIEETAELITGAGGTAYAVEADHLVPEQVAEVVARIRREQGRLDVLVNDIWGGDPFSEWDKPLWEHDLGKGLHMLDVGLRSHIITSHYALGLLSERPGGLLVEVTDGTAEFNRAYRGEFFYDLVKASINRIAMAQGEELAKVGCVAVGVTPGFLRSEAMLDHFGVTEATWRDAAGPDNPHFSLSESPDYLGRGIAALAADPDAARFGGQTLSSGQLAKEYAIVDNDGTRPDFWAYAAANNLENQGVIDDAQWR
ncbi:SDR family oxidoreductase [Hamadaea sp. NPDC051192]|uniref:SDR family oxidoreductase n=1 Tax=Hamadaea sp. NPDC051192 TaxID=3154940 RepID=UPI0034127AE6